MAIWLKQSTASQEVPLGIFVDSTDGNSEESGLTIANTDIKLWKTGATTLASKNSGGATYISNGVYYTVLDATDTNTLGPMVIFVHVAGALAVRLECLVMSANVYDSLVAGTANLTVGTVTGSVQGNVDGSVSGSVGGNVSGNVVGSVGSVAAGGVSASSLAADAVDEIWDEVAEGSLSVRQMLRLFLSALTGKASGGGTATIIFRDNADTKARITATVNASGDRTAVTIDAT